MTTIEEAMNHPLWNDQVALESEMRSMGIQRFNNHNRDAKENGQETRIASVRRLMGDAHTKVVKAIEEFMGDCEAGKAGRKHTAYPYFTAVNDVDLIAYITIRVIMDSMSARKSLTYTSLLIGQSIEDEMNFRRFQEQHIAGFLKVGARAKTKGNAGYRRQSVLGTAKGLGVDLLDWPRRDLILVGSKLVELYIEATGLAQITLSKQGSNRDQYTVEATPETLFWVEKESKSKEWLSPSYLPLLIPPKPWTTPFEGGYWTGQVRRLTLEDPCEGLSGGAGRDGDARGLSCRERPPEHRLDHQSARPGGHG